MPPRGLFPRRAEPVLLALATLAAGAPLLGGRVLAGHDMSSYLKYAQQTAANLRGGVLLPAWAADLNGGFGSPGLIFYPPLVNFLHALPLLVGLPLVVTTGALALTGILLSGIAVRGWIRAEGRPEAALPAALVYMVAPYRMVDLYERSALAENWAFLWPPLLLWIAADRRLRPTERTAGGAIATAGLLLTNLPLAVLFGVALAAWFVLPVGPSGRRASLGAGALFGFGLAAFALIPQALSRRWILSEMWFGTDAQAFRPSRNTLFNSAAQIPDFNVRVSVCLMATFLLTTLAFALASPESRRSRAARYWLGLNVASLVFCLAPVGPLWDRLPVFSELQFPWRLASVMTLALAALAGLTAVRARAGLVVITAALALPFVGRQLAQRRDAFSPRPPDVAPGTNFPDPRAVSEAAGLAKDWRLRNPNLTDVWFLPRTVTPIIAAELAGGRPPLLAPLRHAAAGFLPGPPVDVKVVSWRRLDRTLEVSSPVGGRLDWRVLAFPGMEGEVDGEPVTVSIDPRTGLLAIPLPAGTHRLTWRWRIFGPLAAARWISVGALLGLLLVLLRGRSSAGDPGRGEPGPALEGSTKCC